MKKDFKNIKRRAFTLAELLLSLTVIGIIASIVMPSILGNSNERAWVTQKKVIHTRFSQAMSMLPNLTGYGEVKGTYATYNSGTNTINPQHVDVDTAAETFVREGLSKVIKMTNICNHASLTDCGFPATISSAYGDSYALSSINSIGKLNEQFTSRRSVYRNSIIQYEQLDTRVAAFETVNGESFIVYYNPNCQKEDKEAMFSYTQGNMCVNFIYDLNGIKGPNMVGKDIGIMSVLYPKNPMVVAPIPFDYNIDSSSTVSYNQLTNKCKEFDPLEARVPTKEELASLFYNKKLVKQPHNVNNSTFWSSSTTATDNAWVIDFNDGRRSLNPKSTSNHYSCIKR